MKFTGHERDEKIGLDYMIARYYGSRIARFYSADPVDASDQTGPETWNKYVYVSNQPIQLTDPHGTCFEDACIGEAALAYAGAAAASAAASKWMSEKDPNDPLGRTRAQRMVDAAKDVGSRIVEKVRNLFSKSNKDSSGSKGSDAAAKGKQSGGEGKVYKVDGANTPSGRPYIGRTQQSSPEARGSADGRDRTNAPVVDTYPKGDTAGGRVAEQKKMNENGGVEALDNKRNEIRPKDWEKYGIDPPKK